MNAERMTGRQEPLKFFKIVSLDGLESELWEGPEFVIPKLLPARNVTLLSADGGAGKTQLALTWAAHAAAGRTWAGLPIASCDVLYVSLEEEGRDIRHRMKTIIDAFGLDEALVKARLQILECGKGSLALVESQGSEVVCSTDLMQALSVAARGKRFIVIDNASIAFCANENDRRQVSSFMNLLVDLARENDAAVLLLAHVDKAAVRGRNKGSTYSGSTAWHNSSRSRLVLEVVRPGYVELRQEKLNLGPSAEPIRLEWADGVLTPSTTGVPPRQEELDATDDATLLDALERMWGAGRVVPTSEKGPCNVGLALLPELRKKWGRKRLYAALERLEHRGLIRRESYRSESRHERWRWVRGVGV